MASKIKADSAAIRKYVETLKVYAEHGASHEGATETAFSNLLASTAKPHGWTLIPKKKKVVGKKGQHLPRWHPARHFQAGAQILGRQRHRGRRAVLCQQIQSIR